MKNLFNSVKMQKTNRNMFDLSHDVKMSCDMGLLYPTMCMEALPGDKFNIGCDSLIRFAPLVSPVMHRMDVSMHYFFVPNRILWENWENFITNTEVASALPAHPSIEVAAVNYTKLMDYMGIPTPIGGGPAERINALPFAAYQAIFNEYYRDENLVPEVDYALDDGDNVAKIAALTAIRRRAWEHDYFTSALPFAQKGDAVTLPLKDVQVKVDYPYNSPTEVANKWDSEVVNSAAVEEIFVTRETSDAFLPLSDTGNLYAESSQAGATINDLRRAFRLQEWLEKAARGGSRYIENIKAHFGVQSSDKRLQRPEYITGVKSPVIISEVLNTSNTAEAPQGNMSGHAVSVQQGKFGGYYCEEHGYIIGIMSVMPKTAYQQGIARHFLKLASPMDYYWPEFANIGEQEIWRREIYAFAANGDDTFGYVPRYAEYKFMNSRVAGDFKTTLDFWHLGRIFATTPALNQAFIECTPSERIFAVDAPDVDSLYAHILHKVTASRLMPKFGTPTF